MISLDKASAFYREAFETLRKNDSAPEILVEYYPYVNTNHTIRFRNDKIFVRISDTFESAPAEAHEALAYILVGKLLGKKIPVGLRRIYRSFVRDDSFHQKALEQKRKRGNKRITSPVGEWFDLEEMFAKLNSEYFDGKLEIPALSWSQRRTYRRLGHHDAAHDTIVISRSLDMSGVPEYVVEYVLYHEMLHLVHPVIIRNGRRLIHTPAFKRDEALFEFSGAAEDWISANARKLKRNAKKRH